MDRITDVLIKLAFFGYLAMALYYGWTRDEQLGIPTMILRGILWPIWLIMDLARQGYVPA